MSKIEIILEGVDNATGALKGVGSSLGDLADLVGGAVAQAFGNLLSDAIQGATSALGEFVAGAMDSEKINAQLAAVIKSTGGAAGLTASQVQDMASALASQTTFADDAILQGQNLLLTFTNIGKDVFPDATKAMVDMAAAMGTDVKGGAIQLGKALNDPVEGVSALSRVGVTFSDVQKEVIARMVETGNVAGAQKVILAELTKEFGGSAAAQTETLAGKLDMLRNRLGDAGEGIITAIMPAAKDLFDKVIEPAIPLIEGAAARFGELSAKFLAGVDPLEAARAAIERVQIFLQPATQAVRDLAAVFAESMPAIAARVNSSIEFVRNLFAEFAPRVVAIVADMLHAIGQFWSENGDKIMGTVSYMIGFVRGLIAEFAPEIVANIGDALKTLADFWKEHGDEVIAVVTFAFEVVTTTIGGALLVISSAIRIFAALVTGIWSTLSAVLRGDWSAAWEAVRSTFSTVSTAIGNTLNTLTGSILKLVNSDLASFVHIWEADWKLAATIATSVWDGIVTGARNIFTSVMLTFNDLVAKVTKIFSVSTWITLGEQMIDGIKSGVLGAFQSLLSAVKSTVQNVVAAIKYMLGIRSPSRVFADIGNQMMAGMTLGVTSGAPQAIGATQTAALQAAQAVSNVSNSMTFNVTQYGSPAENTARLRALAGAF